MAVSPLPSLSPELTFSSLKSFLSSLTLLGAERKRDQKEPGHLISKDFIGDGGVTCTGCGLGGNGQKRRKITPGKMQGP